MDFLLQSLNGYCISIQMRRFKNLLGGKTREPVANTGTQQSKSLLLLLNLFSIGSYKDEIPEKYIHLFEKDSEEELKYFDCL